MKTKEAVSHCNNPVNPVHPVKNRPRPTWQIPGPLDYDTSARSWWPIGRLYFTLPSAIHSLDKGGVLRAL
jgi:hypothetical protein